MGDNYNQQQQALSQNTNGHFSTFNMSGPKIAIIIYSTHGHIATMAEAVKKGINDEGGNATILQVAETLPDEVLRRMGAPPKRDYPVIAPADLTQYDAYMFGISARYGGWPAQFKTFWDATGKLWMDGALAGKLAGAFVSTGGPGGGQESTYFSILTTLVHHGLVFVPLGYKYTNALWNAHIEEAHGGSPFGSGVFAKTTGNVWRDPRPVELEVATIQGREFHKLVIRYVVRSTSKGASTITNVQPSKARYGTTSAKTTTQSSEEITPVTRKINSPRKKRSMVGKLTHLLK